MKRRRYRRKPIQKKSEGSDQFLKPTVQTKLSMGQPGDKYEVEADHMADRVVNNKSGDGAIQKKDTSTGSAQEEEVQQKPLASQITPLIQKQAASTGSASEEENAQAKLQRKEDEEPVQKMEEEEAVQSKEEEEVQSKGEEEEVQAKGEEEEVQAKGEEEEVQAKGEEEEVQAKGEEEEVQAKGEEEEVQAKTNGNDQKGTSIEGKLRHGSGGQKMDAQTKAEMEQGFGADFSNVNIHTDSEAAQMSQDIGAQAFTHENDIYFNKGKYDPDTKKGQHLLAHELTHTIQQTGMVQKYREPGATNFGAGNSGALKEDSFNPKTDKEKKPWIQKIVVTLKKKTEKDAHGVDTHKGNLVATYYGNKHKLANISFPVTGGSTTHKSSPANHRVHRIEGLGYMSTSYSDPYTPNPKNKRYNKDKNMANMHYAIFYKGSQAIHGGSLIQASHGCLHVGDMAKLKQLNYHSVKGLTTVIVKYV
jgi:hypothetical protein